MEKSESEKQCDLSNSLTQEEISMLASGKMTGDEWIAWMVKRNKERKQDFQKPSLKKKEDQNCDIDDNLDTKLHNLRVAKNASEEEAAWRNLLERDGWKLSKEEMDFLMGRDEQPPEGDKCEDASIPAMHVDKDNKGRDIESETEKLLCDLIEAETNEEKKAIWRKLLDGDGWKLSKEDMDFLLDRDEQKSPEGDV